MYKTSKRDHDLAFYIGLNLALVAVIASVTFFIWPL
jgi:hypothetical protein